MPGSIQSQNPDYREADMSKARKGDMVKIHYTGMYEDGKAFDSSRGGEPIRFTLGGGQVIQGFDKAVIGMEVGESKKVVIPPEEGYGPYREELVADMSRSKVPQDMFLQVGMTLQAKSPEGNAINVTVARLSEDTVTLDGNPPLAGKTLTFEIELMDISRT